MLEVTIKKELGNFSLDLDFKLDVETLALLGASGCGKSMTLKCIAGIEDPDEGRIVLNNRVLFDSEEKINLAPQERRVGLLFQSYALFPNMTLRENIEIAIRNKKNKDQEVEGLIESFSLQGLEDNYPHQLSGGQQQRVALARMIINQPEILMLDEPFSALDEHLRWQMEKELLEVIERYRVPTIYVSHNKDEVYRLSDSIAVMNEGKIVELASKAAIFNHPKSINTAILIGYKNISSLTMTSSTSLVAEDWKLHLDIEEDPLDYGYLGFDERALKLSRDPADPNRLGLYLLDRIENIENHILVLAGKNQPQPIYMALDKDQSTELKVGDLIYISLPKDRIKLFK